MKTSSFRKLSVGLGFLGPNILGFLAFTLFPMVASLAMAFTNWDLRYHNRFHEESLQFIGLANFDRLIHAENTWRFLGNTLFLMMSIPVAMGGSLCAALLLHRTSTRSTTRWLGIGIAGILLVFSVCGMAASGMAGASVLILISGLAGLILLGGSLGGVTVYRTLFYMPHFTAGVATFVLWKKLYSPTNGPINDALKPVLNALGEGVKGAPAVFTGLGGVAMVLGTLLLVAFVARVLLRKWKHSEIGTGTAGVGLLILVTASLQAHLWFGQKGLLVPAVVCALVVCLTLGIMAGQGKRFKKCPCFLGLGGVTLLSLFFLVALFAVSGLANVSLHLPELVKTGLEPPEWLTDYQWAKPALMLMSLWAAVGSNNMILYLAGLSNVPVELEEAATIDGAGSWQKFWMVSWPQLAPVTFFIFVMSVIHGLQGGFEMARVMTQGGPAGATTTLSYFIYTEGFETGRIGFASAASWVLFLMILFITVLNWRFGSKYTND